MKILKIVGIVLVVVFIINFVGKLMGPPEKESLERVAKTSPVFDIPSLIGKPFAAVRKLAGGTYEAGSHLDKATIARQKKLGLSDDDIYEATDSFRKGRYKVSVTYNFKSGKVKDLFFSDSAAVPKYTALLPAGKLVESDSTPYKIKPVKRLADGKYAGITIINPVQAAAEAAIAARLQKIKAQFSAWNGANRPVQDAIKAKMNDPDSYEHVSTNYVDKGKFIAVMTKFRGKNAFGGLVLNTAVAKVDLDGNVLALQML